MLVKAVRSQIPPNSSRETTHHAGRQGTGAFIKARPAPGCVRFACAGQRRAGVFGRVRFELGDHLFDGGLVDWMRVTAHLVVIADEVILPVRAC
jgi:hypothetical protein